MHNNPITDDERENQPAEYKNAGWFPVRNDLIDSGDWAELSPTAQRLYMPLLRLGNNPRNRAFPSQIEIARLSGVKSLAAIRAGLGDLIARGLIEVIKVGNGRGRSTIYRVPSQRGVSERGISKGGLSPAQRVPLDSRKGPFEPPPKKNKKKNTKKNKGASTWPVVAGVVPEHMRTPGLEAAWKRYEAHRREQRKRITPTQAEAMAHRTLKELDDAERAIDAIDRSIANGWTGIFEEDRCANRARPRRAKHRAANEYDGDDTRL